MVSNMHNTRLLRFLIVVTIVVLTIFIYASYSSTQTLAPPPMRSALQQQQLQPNVASLVAFSITNQSHSSGGNNNDASSLMDTSANFKTNSNSNNLNNAAHLDKTDRRRNPDILSYNANLPSAYGGSSSHDNDIIVIKKLPHQQHHHRVPTIDVNAIDEGALGAAGAVGGTGVGTGGMNVGEDLINDETALEHFNNNNNDLLQEDQYVQLVDNTLGNINNTLTSVGGASTLSHGNEEFKHQPHSASGTPTQQQSQDDQSQIMKINNNNINKIPESDVLIPTSNLQKFIESADKILKNISIQQQQQPQMPAVGASSVAITDMSNKSPLAPETGGDDDNNLLDENDEALPPSVIMTIKGAGSSANHNNNNENDNKQPPSNAKQTPSQQPASASSSSSVAAVPKPPATAAKITPTTKKAVKPQQSSDPTQGIPTQQIYEPGHMDDEIDIEQICPNKGQKLKLLILITSAQTHAEARLAIRQTWGHFGTRRDVSTAFILGRTTNQSISDALTQENMIYGDLIRGHFIDSYNNLTLKTLSSLEWVDRHCPKTKYILKTDDDMFINVPKLLQFLDAHSKDKRVIYGRLAKKWKPIRNKKSKYYISTGQFSASIFPPFTTGPAYVFTSDIVHELYVRSLHEVYLKLEDVFTTGIVAQQLGIKRVHVNEFLNRRIAFNPCNIRKSISVHMIKANEQFDLWKKLLDQTTKCK